MILCDIGNTTYHFLINEEEKRYFLDEKIPCFKETIYYISVNESATLNLKRINSSMVNMEKYINFNTKYKGMGLDRKVACIGSKNAIIVDAGSAIKVDIMKKGKHKGGFILLGLHFIKKMYPKISHKLNVNFNKKVNLNKAPLCTEDAVSYAILQSIIEPIKKIRKKEQIIFTGGDGKLLSQYFENSIYKKHLIFENMKRIIDANYCLA